MLRTCPKIKPKPEPTTRIVLIVDVLGFNKYVIRDLKINDAQRKRSVKRLRTKILIYI